MRKLSSFTVSLLVAMMMFTFYSCGGLFEEEVEQENFLPTPTVKYANGTVSISCDASASDNILWINIFRKNVTDDPDGEFLNIGQVLPYTGLTFTNSAQFTDSHVAVEQEYEYYVRYARKDGQNILYERTSTNKIKTDDKATTEELTLSDVFTSDVSLEYDPGKFTLTTGLSPTTNSDSVFLCLSISNGERTIPVVYSDGLDLRNVLPKAFLDVPITFGCFIKQIEDHDDINNVSTYYWSVPVEVSSLIDKEGNKLESITVPSSAVAGSDIDYNPA